MHDVGYGGRFLWGSAENSRYINLLIFHNLSKLCLDANNRK